ncbi:MAG: hypothetical protein ACLFO2_02825 [Candidatus Woesearchaeota archaeon]
MKQRTCEYHGEASVGLCGWCSRHVCQKCVDEAHGHKLCPGCAEKLSKHKPLTMRRRDSGENVRNVDASLTKEQIEEARKRLERRAAEEDWPELVDD